MIVQRDGQDTVSRTLRLVRNGLRWEIVSRTFGPFQPLAERPHPAPEAYRQEHHTAPEPDHECCERIGPTDSDAFLCARLP